jgi:hypothetical protein
MATLERAVLAHAAHAAHEQPKGRNAPGADRIMAAAKRNRPGFPPQRGAAKRAIAGAKAGQTPTEITATRGKGRGKGKEAAIDAAVGKAGAEAQQQPGARFSSHHLLAKKPGARRMAIRHAIKRPASKRAKTCANAAAQREKRAKTANKIARAA